MRNTGYLGDYRGYAVIRVEDGLYRVWLGSKTEAYVASMSAATKLIDLVVDEGRRANDTKGVSATVSPHG